jgi:hypothetical protein
MKSFTVRDALNSDHTCSFADCKYGMLFFEITVGQAQRDQTRENIDYSLPGIFNITEPFPTIYSINTDIYDLCLVKGVVGLDYFVRTIIIYSQFF